MNNSRMERAYSHLVGDHQAARRAKLLDNARRIEEDLNGVIGKMEQRALPKGKHVFGWEFEFKSLLVFTPAILGFGIAIVLITGRDGARLSVLFSALISVLCGGVLSLWAAKNYQAEVLARRKNYQGFIEKLMHKTVWRTSPGWNLPGMDNARAMDLMELAQRCQPSEVEDAFERLFHLRMQYDQDMTAARLEVSGEQDFIHTYWLDDPKEMDALGMDSLCRAVSELDMDKVAQLIGEGKRLDIQIRPYKKDYFNCPLSLAFNPKEAIADRAGEKNIMLEQAKDELIEQRLSMFAMLIEANPRIWLDTVYGNRPLALHCCFGNERFEAIVDSISKKTRLTELAGLGEDKATNFPKM